MRKLGRHKNEPEDEGWLITFADMSVLLMCFFVLMLAMSSPNKSDFDMISKALMAEGFSSKQDLPTDDPFEVVKSQLATALRAAGFDKDVVVDASKPTIEIEMAASSLFQPGSAKLAPGALPMLKLVSEKVLSLGKADALVEVEGHTDDSAPSDGQFPSNWELSSARASNLVRYFIIQGFPAAKLKAVGLADSRPKAPNRDARGTAIAANQELNRRIVLRLLRGDDHVD